MKMMMMMMMMMMMIMTIYLYIYIYIYSLPVNHDWTCYFLPTSSCQEILLKTGDNKHYVIVIIIIIIIIILSLSYYHYYHYHHYHQHSHSLGKLVPYPNFTTNDRKAIPDNYKHLGLSFW